MLGYHYIYDEFYAYRSHAKNAFGRHSPDEKWLLSIFIKSSPLAKILYKEMILSLCFSMSIVNT